ncbi:putative DD41D transposase [Trichonephila clavipes]|nr:putative DD41D transposase [Trichonephila clavipes]
MTGIGLISLAPITIWKEFPALWKSIEVKVGITFQDGDRFKSCQVIYSQFGLAIHQNDHQVIKQGVDSSNGPKTRLPLFLIFISEFCFTDEAHFWLNGYVNKQNCRIWSETNPQVYVEIPLHSEKLTVWSTLWTDGIIGPYFFKNDEDHNVTVNGDRYRAMITNFFIPELYNHVVQKLWFQTRQRNMSHSSCHNRFIERHVWRPPNFTFWTCELGCKIL